ncbi:MAG: glycosyltransferase [Promethearchaeota archaeon]
MSNTQDKIWIFTFEYAGIAKVGGLGEVPANQAKYLASDFDITVFIPSHGQIDRLRKTHKLEKISCNCIGKINPMVFGVNKPEEIYNISFFKLRMENINIILVSGENPFTSRFLDDTIVYNPDTLDGKICLFSIGLRTFIDFIIENHNFNLPNIIHLHDYHVVIPFFGVKQELIKNGLDTASIITIHLLTWPRYNIDFYYTCGINLTPITVLLKDGIKSLILNEIFKFHQNTDYYSDVFQIPTVEQVGALICDLITTVSQSYLISHIIPNCGRGLIEFKSDFVWDGCDWDYEEMYQKINNTMGSEIREVYNISNQQKITRSHLKEYLLTYKISHLSQSPLINSAKVLATINEISDGNSFLKNGMVKSFSDSGPLLITTGRISPQKGFDIVFNAVPEVLNVIANAKFLFLILPTEYSLDEIRKYSYYVKKYPDNIRIIFGVASEIFNLAHLAADVYCALSRWEPFGIMVLEAMASKLPIIATKVGGLQETVIDMRLYPEIGTGILIEKDNPSQFSNALISLFKALEVANKVEVSSTRTIYDTDTLKIVNQIPDDIIKSRVLIDANYFYHIRENCIRRVKNNFTWKKVSKKLIELYSKILEIHSLS